MDVTLVVGWLVVAGGLWMAQRAFRARSRRLALLRDSVRTSGKVVRLEDTTTEGDVANTYAPVVRYKAQDGQDYETKLRPRLTTDISRVGMMIPIFYERGNPQNVVDAKRTWDVNLVCVLSLMIVLIGVGFIYTAYQDRTVRNQRSTSQSATSTVGLPRRAQSHII